MKHKIVAVFATAAISVLSVGVAAGPAFADCPANTFCLYETNGYRDGEFRFAPTTTCLNLSSGINNDANAMRNYRSHAVRMWDLPGCGGSSTYYAQANSYDSNFGNNDFSNKASSLKRV
ncbi:peptidase inhibitor family I36 protein [Plantactinospora sp. KLBMP9567]|uniref:peptidase inhibitor family I36 protein n=1 Tax=Plantactinospora sp. KLBMP9567 TaxID=3085900 RepID=UPI002982B3A3|nr:peptidase inhibitor family I36 protein [Plantactinospora sp. KLBMP9567]MDW5323945.1 peptidase inhibitor family I36 protein [Plantactinospora sp. KLBMP9567]